MPLREVARRLPSIRLKVAASFTLLLIALLSGSLLTLGWQVQSDLTQELDENLQEIARTELASANDGPEARPHVHSTGGQHQTLIFSTRGHIVVGSPELTPEDRAGFLETAQRALGRGPQEQPGFRVLAVPYGGVQGIDTFALGVRLPTHELHSRLNRIWLWLACIGMSVGLVGGALVYHLSRRLTGPVEGLALLALQVSEGRWELRSQLNEDSWEVHALQQSINRMLDRLQGTLAELELRNDQLRQFVADASHELRNPVHALRGTLEVALRRERTPEEYREALEISGRETVRLSKLVDDLLLLTRLELERMVLNVESVDLGALMVECLAAHQALAEQRGVEFHHVRQPLPSVSGDALRLRQVLDNLVDNALQHSPPGTRVSVAALPTGQRLRVEVSDQGPGLSVEQARHVFDRFCQLQGQPARGLGLGLSLARRLVEAHQGSIGVDPVADGGSSFWFELPLIEISSEASKLTVCNHPPSRLDSPGSGKDSFPGEVSSGFP